jgi:NADPH2:quinone reductase
MRNWKMLTGRQLTSTAFEDGRLRLALEERSFEPPTGDDLVVRMEAAPINPTDLGLLLGPADVSTVKRDGEALVLEIPRDRLSVIATRLNLALPVGIEGAGVVVAAGPDAKKLEGKRVALFGEGMFADYRKASARDVVQLPEGATSAQGAAIFVNPMTSLGFVETAHREGHKAIIQTAAASNLGQMLLRICLKDGIPLINIVRSRQQEELLLNQGAKYVLNSQAEDFRPRLVEAVAETGATLAFDAICGGKLGSEIIGAMEKAATRRMSSYSRYGTSTFKQLYVYGRLDPSPMILNRNAFGMQWSVSGWLLMPFLEKIGEEAANRMRQRVLDELTTTFVSHYTRTIGLTEALDPEVLRAYERKATGEKYLIDPSLG